MPIPFKNHKLILKSLLREDIKIRGKKIMCHVYSIFFSCFQRIVILLVIAERIARMWA